MTKGSSGGQHTALYRKYRSKSLAEVVGQRHITDILSRALKEKKIAHAYLFTGPRGVGKTSIARILAHEINELPYEEGNQHLDIIEIDAASNNSVEDIRDLRERVQLAPISANKKVYIIDEVHMLSKAAFNALLKTLEEPPEHIVFILATTDADKLPDTIVSRTQRFNFRTISTEEVTRHLGWIASQEGFPAEEDALRLIAMHGEGTFRDSISLLDQLRSAADAKTGVTKELVETFLGLPPSELMDQLLAAYEAGDIATIVALLDTMEHAGTQPTVIATELIRTVRSVAAERPHLLPLLDALLDVAGSSRPDIKLLTVLAKAKAAPQELTKQKTVALAAPVPVISVPVVDKKPKKLESKKEPVAETEPIAETTTTSIVAGQTPFDWSALLTHIQKSDIALFSLLSKCSSNLDEATLTIYTGNAFYKKKLDSARYRTTIATALGTLGMGSLLIAIEGTTPPPVNEVAASVAAIMGGGEEYAIDDVGKEE
jgi:DNA polymerase-3 subunit gamma/tau